MSTTITTSSDILSTITNTIGGLITQFLLFLGFQKTANGLQPPDIGTIVSRIVTILVIVVGIIIAIRVIEAILK